MESVRWRKLYMQYSLKSLFHQMFLQLEVKTVQLGISHWNKKFSESHKAPRILFKVSLEAPTQQGVAVDTWTLGICKNTYGLHQVACLLNSKSFLMMGHIKDTVETRGDTTWGGFYTFPKLSLEKNL